jgi:hypothetical protein
MRLGWGPSFPAPDAAQQECCEPGSTLLCMGLFSRFFVRALPCTAEGTLCRVRDTRSLVPRAYGTNRSNSNTSCSSAHLEIANGSAHVATRSNFNVGTSCGSLNTATSLYRSGAVAPHLRCATGYRDQPAHAAFLEFALAACCDWSEPGWPACGERRSALATAIAFLR